MCVDHRALPIHSLGLCMVIDVHAHVQQLAIFFSLLSLVFFIQTERYLLEPFKARSCGMNCFAYALKQKIQIAASDFSSFSGQNVDYHLHSFEIRKKYADNRSYVQLFVCACVCKHSVGLFITAHCSKFLRLCV